MLYICLMGVRTDSLNESYILISSATVQRKYLPDPFPDHARKHQQKLCRLQHQPQNTVQKSEPHLDLHQPGDCYF